MAELKKEWTVIEYYNVDNMIHHGTYENYYEAIGVGYDALMDFNEDVGKHYITPIDILQDGENRKIELRRIENDGRDVLETTMLFLRKKKVEFSRLSGYDWR